MLAPIDPILLLQPSVKKAVDWYIAGFGGFGDYWNIYMQPDDRKPFEADPTNPLCELSGQNLFCLACLHCCEESYSPGGRWV